jgi:hypothetical protein
MGAVVLFALLAVFFYAYPRLFMNSRASRNDHLSETGKEKELTMPTGKLLSEPPFEPASVTEDSTELLHIPRRS